MSPSAARRSRGGGRFYVWGTERYWSVTTIIGGGIPKDALKFWAARVVAEYAYDHTHEWLSMPRSRAVDHLKREPLRFTGERADVGSAVHEIAEAVALQKPAPSFDSREERAIVAAFLDWTRSMSPVFVSVEAEVFHRTQRYAGRLDAIIELDAELITALRAQANLPAEWGPHAGRPTRLLIDYKTGGAVEEDKGVYPESALQLNAYAKAEFVGLPNGTEAPLPALDGAAVLHLGARGWRLVPVRLGDDVFKAFLFAREVFRWMEQTSKTVLGNPVEAILDFDPLKED